MRLSTLQLAIALLSPETAAGWTKESDLPFYGLSPPVYPTPQGEGGTSPQWATAYAKAHAFVSQLTLEEKVNVTNGFPDVCVGMTGSVPRLGFRGLCFEDAPFEKISVVRP